MLGAIIGDVVGSSREFAPIKSKDFDLFAPTSMYTDDTILTVAVASAIVDGVSFGPRLKEYATEYVTSYGHSFWTWANSPTPEPYGSWGNGAAMRVSPAAWYGRDLLHALELARASAAASHDHPEAIRGAQATALAIYLARAGYSAGAIEKIVSETSGYDLTRTVDQVRETCVFELKSWISVPEALICVLKATSFEDAIRNAVSIGGDADTQAAIAGSIAEPLFGIPDGIEEEALKRIPPAVRQTFLEIREDIAPVVDPSGQLANIPVWDPQSRIDFERVANAVDEAALAQLAYHEQLERQLNASWVSPRGAWLSIGGAAQAAIDWFKARWTRPASTPTPSEPAGEIQSKLVRTKLEWAEEGRFLTGREADPKTERLPPGQHLTEAWPVLDLGPKPYIDLDKWRLDVTGAIGSPKSYAWSDIHRLPQTRMTSDIHCVTSWSRFDNDWEGISTRDLMSLIDIQREARFVRLTSCDGYTTNLSIDDFSADGALLAHSWGGEGLSREHGAPLRLVIPHLYFWKSAKWLKAIAFLEADEPGYWETRGYHNRGNPWREERYKRPGQQDR